MTAPLNCPEIECWQALVTATLPPDQREHYENHLELCLTCQERLDRFEECGAALWGLAQEVGDPTSVPADLTLVQVMERLFEEKGLAWTVPVEPADLHVLEPTDRPGVLGMLGHYEVREVIGVGGMGIVLKAFDPALGRLVAIKVIAGALAGSRTARQRFTREAQAAAAVCHDHIVTVHAVHEADGLPYLVMEYVAGESLQDRLDRVGPLEVVEVVRIGMQTAAGLAAAHARGLIHRDIKPANLLLEGEPRACEPPGLSRRSSTTGLRVKITDFGLARMTDDVQLTRNGVVVGTPEYMAPEQARGEPVDHRADLFSLGSVLYATCTGAPPFRGASPVAVLRQVCDQAPMPIRALNPNVPTWLEAVIGRLLAKNPRDRFQSAAELAGLLEAGLAHLRQPALYPSPELSLPTPDSPEPPAPKGRFQRPLGLAVLLFLVALGLSSALLLLAEVPPGQSPSPGIYQDFRGGKGPLPPLKLFGQNSAVVTPEDGGLRITLAANRPQPAQVVGVLAEVRLSGDFEITGAYQLLSADPPLKGPGAGVSLNIATNWKSSRWGRIARLRRVEEENVYVAGMDSHTRAAPTVPTTAKAGQMRLARQGSILHYLAAEEPGGPFREISSEEFGPEDVEVVRFMVNTNGSPTALDARLVDLQIRFGNLTPFAAAAPAKIVLSTRSLVWLMIGGLFGLALLCSWLALRVCLYLDRNRRSGKTSNRAGVAGGEARAEAVAPAVSVLCPGCGKALKVKAELAGKKVKCPRCGQAVLVHMPQLGEADSPTER